MFEDRDSSVKSAGYFSLHWWIEDKRSRSYGAVRLKYVIGKETTLLESGGTGKLAMGKPINLSNRLMFL